jgi:ABC-2 type transport system permease protein
MYEVLQIVQLRLQLMARDKVFLLLLFLFPMLFACIVGATQSFQKESVIPVAVVDEDRTDYSQMVVERFAGKEGIRIIHTSREEAYRLVENYKVEAAFIILSGFKQAILDEKTDKTIEMLKNPGSLSYGILGEMLGSEVMRLSANTSAANRAEQLYAQYGFVHSDTTTLWEHVWKYADSQWEPKPLMTIRYQEIEGTNVKEVTRMIGVSPTSLTGLGMLLVFLLLFVVLHSRWLIEERENGTLKRIMSVPGLLWKFYLGNIAALFILSLLLVVLCEGMSLVLFKAHLLIHPLQYVVLGAYGLAVIGLGMFFSAVFTTGQQMQAGAPLVALLTGFISGCFWPFLPLEGLVRVLALCTPQGWALAGMKALLVNDYSVFDIAQVVIMLFGIGLTLCLYSFFHIRRRVLAS